MTQTLSLLPNLQPVHTGGFQAPKRITATDAEFVRFKQQRYSAATYPEFIAYRWLTRQGYVEYKDFAYQVPLGGGRSVRGGFVLDFLFYPTITDGRRIPADTYNEEFHAGAVFGNPPQQRAQDRIKKEVAERNFGTMVYIWEPDLLGPTDRTMRLALQGVSTGKVP